MAVVAVLVATLLLEEKQHIRKLELAVLVHTNRVVVTSAREESAGVLLPESGIFDGQLVFSSCLFLAKVWMNFEGRAKASTPAIGLVRRSERRQRQPQPQPCGSPNCAVQEISPHGIVVHSGGCRCIIGGGESRRDRAYHMVKLNAARSCRVAAMIDDGLIEKIKNQLGHTSIHTYIHVSG